MINYLYFLKEVTFQGVGKHLPLQISLCKAKNPQSLQLLLFYCKLPRKLLLLGGLKFLTKNKVDKYIASSFNFDQHRLWQLLASLLLVVNVFLSLDLKYWKVPVKLYLMDMWWGEKNDSDSFWALRIFYLVSSTGTVSLKSLSVYFLMFRNEAQISVEENICSSV